MALKMEEVEVTPELAMEWLEGMGKNRRLSQSNLDAIILAMNEGVGGASPERYPEPV